MLDLFRTLPGIVKDLEDAEPVREAMVFAVWRRIAGPSLAEHAVPLKLERSTLSVAVSNVTWQRHLKDLAGQMLFKINAAVGTPMVSFIQFEINEPAVLEARSQSVTDETQLRQEAEKALTPELINAAAKIEDEELRRQFLLAAGNCLVRKERLQSST